jgi:hypothetical protein
VPVRDLETYRVRDADVSAERLDGDVIVVNLASGAYFSLSGSAADVWTAATSGSPADIWLEALDAEYSCSVPRGDIADVIDACLTQGLLEVASPTTTEPPSLPRDFPRSAWSRPRMDVFTDLQDLLLLDPIHDAGDLGWPQSAPPSD